MQSINTLKSKEKDSKNQGDRSFANEKRIKRWREGAKRGMEEVKRKCVMCMY